MDCMSDPVRIKIPTLWAFAYQAAWIATATAAVTDLEELLVGVSRRIDIPRRARMMRTLQTERLANSVER
jgi:hypothetical protein